MCTVQVKLSLPDELVAELDRLRGDISRSWYVRRLIESVAGPVTILEPRNPAVRMASEVQIVNEVPPEARLPTREEEIEAGGVRPSPAAREKAERIATARSLLSRPVQPRPIHQKRS